MKKEIKVHYLKIIQPFFADISSGLKDFELRKDDRNFQVDDVLVLDLYEYGNLHRIIKIVKYKLSGGKFGLKKGYCILGF